jgi:WD40 repeat protein
LWNVNPGNLSNTFTGHRDAVTSLNFSPDGQILASGSADTTINLWNSANGTLIKTLIGHRDPVRSIEFNPDRTTLLSSSENSGAILWNLNLDELMNQGCDRLHNYLQTGSRSDNQPLCP